MGAGPEGVETARAGGPTPVWTADPLFALLDELRDEGFTLGVGEYLEAQKAAAACHRDGLGHNPHRLRNYLAPVLCKSLEKQQIFYRRFDAWWLDRAGGREDELPPKPQPEKKLAEAVRRTRPWKWWAVAVLGAALVVSALTWWSRPATFVDTLTVTAPPSEKPTLPKRLVGPTQPHSQRSSGRPRRTNRAWGNSAWQFDCDSGGTYRASS